MLFFPSKSLYCWGVLIALLLVVASGCRSSSDVQLIAEARGPLTLNSAAVTQVAARQALTDAMGMIRSGEHSMAIPRLTSLTSRYPNTDAAIDAWYFLGLTYYKIDGIYNAEKYFSRYLKLRPEGKYAALSREYLAGISRATQQHNLDRGALAERVAKYEGVAEPEELATHLELADAYWDNSEYEKAAAIYMKVLKAWPSLRNDVIIRRRMELGPDGGWVILTPAEVTRRYNEAEPLSIFNTTSWRSRYRSYQLDYRETSYNVSGQVMNRSETVLRDVRIATTIFNFSGHVFDVRTVQLGTLRPGDTRAFSVGFSNFDTIENVRRYECVGTYQR